MKWKLSDFWTQTLSCTLGTIIGIVLTFGTSAWINPSFRARSFFGRKMGCPTELTS